MGNSREKRFPLRVRIVIATALALIGICGLSATASATLPGKNGPLLISTFIKGGDGNYSTYVYTETTAGRSTMLLGGADSFSDPAVSPNGKSIVYSRYPGYQLWLGPFGDPEKAKAITPAIEDTNFGEAVFSPDGKSIYHSAKIYSDSGTSWTIKRYSIKTKKSKEYKLKPFEDSGLSDISPNGRLVSFNRGTDEDKSRTWFLDTKTGKSRAFKSKAPAQNLNFSPDGKSVTYAAPVKEGFEIFTSRLDGKGVKRLTRGALVNYSPVYSPDGRQIAFTQGADATKKIGIVTLKTGKIKYIAAPGDYTEVEQWLARR
ncbi:MAG TPA: hypothetical protein VMF31_03660 [Solirubrobacterales bacterium]|nr:hypothetical protein [Solirubrobacterales bacterium]